MQFSDAVNWTVSDSVVMFVLLFGTGASYQLLARQSDKFA